MAPILGLQNSSEKNPFGCPTAAGSRASGSCFLCSLFSVYPGCQMARVLQIRILHSSRSWWSMRKGVRRYHTVQCISTFAGFFGWLWDLGTVFLNCWSIRISGLKASRLKQSCNWLTCAIPFTKLCHNFDTVLQSSELSVYTWTEHG
jgi:hypothetical protein